MAYGIGAHGIWHYGHLPSKFGCLPNAIGLQNRVTLTFAALAPCLEGSLVEPVGAEWPPKAAKEDPKADTWRPKVAKGRPDVTHRAPSTENSRKKLSEAWPRAAQNHEI